MKFVILAALAAVALAAPQSYSYDAPSRPKDSHEVIAIIREDRIHQADGTYNYDFEAENGIKVSQSGAPDGAEGSIVKAGSYFYTAPGGTEVEVQYATDKNGYQPQSDLLPVVYEFPHPIPQFVLNQIAFTTEEDARRSNERLIERPSRGYGAPQ